MTPTKMDAHLIHVNRAYLRLFVSIFVFTLVLLFTSFKRITSFPQDIESDEGINGIESSVTIQRQNAAQVLHSDDGSVVKYEYKTTIIPPIL